METDKGLVRERERSISCQQAKSQAIEYAFEFLASVKRASKDWAGTLPFGGFRAEKRVNGSFKRVNFGSNRSIKFGSVLISDLVGLTLGL